MAVAGIFTLNPTVDLTVPDVLGLWQAAPVVQTAPLVQAAPIVQAAPVVQAAPLGEAEAVPFGTAGGEPGTGPADEETTVWNVDLSGGPEVVNQRLRVDLARLDSVRLLLPEASRRFNALAQQVMDEEIPSFAAGELSVPEADALAWLQVGANPELLQEGPESGPEVAFVAGLPSKADVLKAAGQVQEFTTQVRQTLAQFALVQTTIDGRLFGATRVSWLGDFSIGWTNDLNSIQAEQHAQAVRTALATRRHWLRIAMLISAGALKVGASLGTGIGLLVAATSAYRFVKLVIDEYQQMTTDDAAAQTAAGR